MPTKTIRNDLNKAQRRRHGVAGSHRGVVNMEDTLDELIDLAHSSLVEKKKFSYDREHVACIPPPAHPDPQPWKDPADELRMDEPCFGDEADYCACGKAENCTLEEIDGEWCALSMRCTAVSMCSLSPISPAALPTSESFPPSSPITTSTPSLTSTSSASPSALLEEEELGEDLEQDGVLLLHCSSCKLRLPRAFFSLAQVRKYASSRLNPICKACVKARQPRPHLKPRRVPLPTKCRRFPWGGKESIYDLHTAVHHKTLAAFRADFLAARIAEIAALAQSIQLARPAPVNPTVVSAFLANIEDLSRAGHQPLLHLVFHGTPEHNFPSIFTRGLLIPGQGNELKSLHGTVHGVGIYTSTNPLDSLSYTGGSKYVLLCAWLESADSSQYLNHGSFRVVYSEGYILPLCIVEMSNSNSFDAKTKLDKAHAVFQHIIQDRCQCSSLEM